MFSQVKFQYDVNRCRRCLDGSEVTSEIENRSKGAREIDTDCVSCFIVEGRKVKMAVRLSMLWEAFALPPDQTGLDWELAGAGYALCCPAATLFHKLIWNLAVTGKREGIHGV